MCTDSNQPTPMDIEDDVTDTTIKANSQLETSDTISNTANVNGSNTNGNRETHPFSEIGI